MRLLTPLLAVASLCAGETVVVPLVLTPMPGEDAPSGWGYVNAAEAPEQVLMWAGRPLLFDRRDGRVRWDRDGNRRFDEIDGPALAEDETIAVPTPLGGAMVEVPLQVSGRQGINLRSPCALVGTWAGRRIALDDYRMDGRWDTWGEDRLHRQGDDGSWTELGELQRLMLIDGVAWAVVVDHALPALRLTREELPLAQVAVAGGDAPEPAARERTHLRLISADGRCHATVEQHEPPRPLPVGVYDIEFGQLVRDGLSFQTDWSIANRITVPPGATAVLALAEPERLEAIVVGAGAGIIIIENLALVTASGLRWRACVQDLRAGDSVYAEPTWVLRGAGREEVLGKLEYG